jgi:hypothetical protein
VAQAVSPFRQRGEGVLREGYIGRGTLEGCGAPVEKKFKIMQLFSYILELFCIFAL